MYLQNLHTHSQYCDGKNTLTEMAERAVACSFDSVGFSRHANMPYKTNYSQSPETILEFKKEAEELKKKYHGVLEIFTGVESDLYSIDSLEGYDYVIGSFHCFKFGENMVPFDRDAEYIKKLCEDYFDNSGIKLARRFYEESARLAEIGADIIGHFDLVTKHSPVLHLIDEDDPEYQALAIECVRALAKKVQIFEVNVGCVARGYKKEPYLAPFIIKELKRLDCGITISSDCHDTAYFNDNWDMAKKRLLDCGYKAIAVLTKEGFKESALV